MAPTACPHLEIVQSWRLTEDLKKSAKEFQDSSITDITPDTYSTYHHISDGFGGDYYGEVDYKRRRNGYGRCRWDNGDLYFGYWSKDKMEGEGHYLWTQTGSIYVGSWRLGECHGPGTYLCGPKKEKGSMDTAGFIIKGLWKKGHPKKVQVLSARLFSETKTKSLGELQPAAKTQMIKFLF